MTEHTIDYICLFMGFYFIYAGIVFTFFFPIPEILLLSITECLFGFIMICLGFAWLGDNDVKK